jgi:hypothetical protein
LKKLLILAFFGLLLCSHAFGVAFSAEQSCAQSTQSTLTCTASMTFAGTEAVVLYTGSGLTGLTFSVSDTCANTWTHQPAASFTQGSVVQIDAWTVSSAIAGTCAITVTRSAGTTKFVWIAASYTGVSSIGAFNAAGNGTSSSSSIALTTQDANNFVVAGFATGSSATVYSASVGNLRGQQASTASGSSDSIVLNDNTSASVASVTNTVSLSNTVSAAKGAIELRTSGASCRVALSSDSGGTVLLNNGGVCSYTLPGTPPSNQFNATVMAIGTGTYTITVSAPALLNSGSASITLLRWETVRISSDGTNYHAEHIPPVAGNGILITPSATAITITSSTVTTSFTTTAATTDNVTVTGHGRGRSLLADADELRRCRRDCQRLHLGQNNESDHRHPYRNFGMDV